MRRSKPQKVDTQLIVDYPIEQNHLGIGAFMETAGTCVRVRSAHCLVRIFLLTSDRLVRRVQRVQVFGVDAANSCHGNGRGEGSVMVFGVEIGLTGGADRSFV